MLNTFYFVFRVYIKILTNCFYCSLFSVYCLEPLLLRHQFFRIIHPYNIYLLNYIVIKCTSSVPFELCECAIQRH